MVDNVTQLVTGVGEEFALVKLDTDASIAK